MHLESCQHYVKAKLLPILPGFPEIAERHKQHPETFPFLLAQVFVMDFMGFT